MAGLGIDPRSATWISEDPLHLETDPDIERWSRTNPILDIYDQAM